MNYKHQLQLSLIILFICNSAVHAADYPQLQLEKYQQQGVQKIDKENGRKLWNSTVNNRSCTTCHGATPSVIGEHLKTRKRIEPMALSVNPKRFQDGKKIEKWFLRNCKWTFSRVCTVQEKANILSWLSSQ
jgi:hypothetical protein